MFLSLKLLTIFLYVGMPGVNILVYGIWHANTVVNPWSGVLGKLRNSPSFYGNRNDVSAKSTVF
jgi:hypothetical protein